MRVCDACEKLDGGKKREAAGSLAVFFAINGPDDARRSTTLKHLGENDEDPGIDIDLCTDHLRKITKRDILNIIAATWGVS